MAIKAEDLRIGNLLYFPFHKEVVEVVGLPLLPDGKQGVQVKTQGTTLCEELLEQFNPIPLTEECLIGSDFEWQNNENLKGYWINGVCVEKIGNMFIERKTGVILKHVHKLQNLYYALTNAELTIK